MSDSPYRPPIDAGTTPDPDGGRRLGVLCVNCGIIGLVGLPLLYGLHWTWTDSIRDLFSGHHEIVQQGKPVALGGAMVLSGLLIVIGSQLRRGHPAARRRARLWSVLAFGLAVALAAFFWVFEDDGDRRFSTFGALGLTGFPLLLLVLSRPRRGANGDGPK